MTLNATVAKVTARIAQRSQASRADYLQQVEAAASRKPGADRLGCANVAHAFAAMPADDKSRASGLAAIPVVNATERGPNIGVVTAYNDLIESYKTLTANAYNSTSGKTGTFSSNPTMLYFINEINYTKFNLLD
jgi:phosphogluconate dehydratase